MAFTLPRRPDGLLQPLTARQTEVAELLATGLGTTEIARTLGISYDAAKQHIENIADLLENPRRLGPLSLARQWAIAQEYLRLGARAGSPED